MQLSELYLDRYLYRDNDQSSETQDASFVSADSSDPVPSSIPSGGAAQDINTSNVKIDGAQLEPGTFPSTVLDVANWGWGQTCVFSSTDDDTVSWTDGDFTSADGTTYSIVAGNTGAMTQKTYIYLSLLESETVYQHTTTPSDAVGLGKVLVAVAEDAADDATFMLSEAAQIIGDNIMANSINASKIVTGSVTTAQLNFTPLYSSNGTGSIIATINASGETLNISAAKINISGSTTFSAGYDPTTKITEGGAAADINSNSTTITGNKIRTGEIESYGYTYVGTVYSSVGMQIDLDNGMIRSPNFAVDVLGNAYFKGELVAGSGYIGGWKINSTSIYTGTENHSGYTSNAGDITIYSDGSVSSIHANKFYIDTIGALVATSVTLTGEINATSGVINGDLVATGINATNITTGVLSVGGTNQPTELNLLPSTHGSGTTTAKLNWKDTEDEVLGKVWTDNLGFMGFNTPVDTGVGSGAWASGGNLNTERQGLAGAGTSFATLSFGGATTRSYGYKITEEYNGTSWSAATDLNIESAFPGGTGTQYAGLKMGGSTVSSYSMKDTEEYDGTTWSTGGDLVEDVEQLAACGTQTAGLSFGGFDSYYSARTQEYDGTTWSTSGSLTSLKAYLGGCGTQTAGLSFGGRNTEALATVEEYNGTTWSSANNLSSTTYGLAGCGTQAALCFGGFGLGAGYVFNKTEKMEWYNLVFRS